MTFELREGPRGTDGGEPFPEVSEEIHRIERVTGRIRPWMVRMAPTRLIVRAMRGKTGLANRDIAKGTVSTLRRSIPGRDGEVDIRIYTPAGSDEIEVDRRSILLYFHGGGWVAGSVDTVENIGRGIADRSGFIVINVDYRLAPEHKFPAGLEDCYAAVQWAARPGNVVGGDASRVVVAGDSAGGTFATACCLLAHERGGPDISYQVLIYPAVDLSGDYDATEPPGKKVNRLNGGTLLRRLYVEHPARLADPRCSPWLVDDLSFMPPALVLTAEYCDLRGQGEAYADRLTAAGVTTHTIRYNGVNHAFLDKVGVWPYADTCIDDIAEALRTLP